ncbi:GAF domain-containing sensor histidine kinase [Phormidium tenue FACHB-886]|nr:GAF domain-containing sensor histidine kinase [Phormidium tenue FACHB-886]
MPNSFPQTCSQHLSPSNPKGDIDLVEQMQERIIELQQALALESTLRRISETIRASLDEAHIVKTAVQELALALEANCYAVLSLGDEQQLFGADSSLLGAISGCQTRVISLNHNQQITQCLQAGQYLQLCFTSSSSQEKFTLFACSIANGDKNWGSLWIIQEMSRRLTNFEINLVQQVANQCAIALHQSSLFQTAQIQVEELKRLNQVKDDFINRVTHDLRSPLSNMRLSIHLLEHFLAEETLNRGQNSLQNSAYSNMPIHLKILQSECEQSITLINDLLDLQRLESDKQPLPLDAIDLKDWLIDLLQPFKERFQQQQLALELQIAPDLPLLMSNSAGLHRVLTELLHNACKYTPPHETVSINVSSNLESVQIQVSNAGVQIPSEELPRIFERFYRIPGSDRWKQGGTGLGLTLVKQLMNYLGGSIAAESENAQTCFTIQLPLKPFV